MNTTTKNRTNRLRQGLVALVASLAFAGVTAHSASAAILYNPGGGRLVSIGHCSVDSHTIQLQSWIYKDPGYTWQSVQTQYQIRDYYTGRAVMTSDIRSYFITTTATVSYTGVMPMSGRYRIFHAARYGTTTGFRPWSAWVEVDYSTSWNAKGWFQQPTTLCYS